MRLNLLSARSLILATAIVLVLSVLGMCLSMLGPNDSRGLGRDSFGTRAGGFRGLFELLESLHVPVARVFAPPVASAGSRETLVLFNPDPRLVATGPKYIQSLLPWVESGGRIVVSPSIKLDSLGTTSTLKSDETPLDVLQLLEVEDRVKRGKFSESFVEEDYTAANKQRDKDIDLRGLWGRRADPKPPKHYTVTTGGSLAGLSDQVMQLAVPAEGFATLRAKTKNLAGWVTCVGADGKKHIIAAALDRGAGAIVVVSDASIFSNRLIARADNSVLAAHLLSPQRVKVVFDEFYHGRAVRGNALYLLTRPGFAAATTALLLVVGALAWRSTVFLGPPLSKRTTTRRDIREYVNAMGQFLGRGRGSRQFLVREIRDGVLREVCRELKLPMDTLQVETVTGALARRNPERARRLEAAVRDVDACLADTTEFPRKNTLPTMQRLADCL
jgi:hypothetical protein